MTPPILTIPWHAGDDPAFLRAREWLVTNGLGGYASGTLLGIGTRRYHGLFIPNLPSPYGRTVLVPRLDETIEYQTESVQLSGAEFADGHYEGAADRVLTEFRHDWQTPVWVFTVNGSTIEKRLAMPHGHNTVYVLYTLVRGGPVRLHLRPYVALRQHGAPLNDPQTQGPFPLTIFRGRHELHLGEGLPALRLCLRPRCGVFVAEEKEEREVLYRVERDRGYDCTADLRSPGYFTAELSVESPVGLVASVEPWETLEPDAALIFDAERRRAEKVLSLAPEAARAGIAAQLVLAADQFVVLPGSRPEEQVLARTSGEEVRTIVAGYHWFTDWGRDTMISLEGLTLCTGRQHEAKAILQTFAHALDRYARHSGDTETVRALYPTLRSIIDHHQRGTHFGIGMDPRDGLIRASAEGFALTWMDAKVGDWVVTPRRGKPVEIQALWYNALRLMAAWSQDVGEPAGEFLTLADRVQASFNRRFWSADGGYLYDVIDGEQGDEPSLRPNQIFAISLPFPILAEQYWRPVLETVTDKLLTPVGLRTLAPGHKDYKSRYDGDLRSRDAAYHQGTVWPWLIGHFLDAWRRLAPDDDARVRTFLHGFDDALRAAGIGTLSEIFDAEPPYAARGCIAQAWSVAEVLRSVLTHAKTE
jgi:glycogen debranching enzyme